MKTVKVLWDEILEIMEENIKKFSIESLEDGVRVSKIQEVEKELDIKFPNELKALYMANNGTVGLGAILGFELIPIEDLVTEWKNNKKLLENGTFDNINITSSVEGAIKEVQFNEKWIPFAFNNVHTYLAIDLNPDENGEIGQIINFGDAQGNEVKYVVAASVEELLKNTIMIYEYNGLKIDEEIDYPLNKETELSEFLVFMDKHFFNIIDSYKTEESDYSELSNFYNDREYDDYQDEDGYDSYDDDYDDDEYDEY